MTVGKQKVSSPLREVKICWSCLYFLYQDLLLDLGAPYGDLPALGSDLGPNDRTHNSFVTVPVVHTS